MQMTENFIRFNRYAVAPAPLYNHRAAFNALIRIQCISVLLLLLVTMQNESTGNEELHK